MNDLLEDVIELLTEEQIKQYEKDKINGKEYIKISKEQLIKNIIKFIKEMKNTKY